MFNNNFNLLKIWRIIGAAENILKLYRWAIEDGKLSPEEINVLIVHGLVPIAEVLGFDMGEMLPAIDGLSGDARKMLGFATMNLPTSERSQGYEMRQDVSNPLGGAS